MSRRFPPAYPHGDIREIFPDIYFVTGSVQMPGPLPVRFSRNMTIIRRDGALVLVNSLRLDDARLAALDELGKVAHVIRLAGFHGMDDPFYKERYGATVWAMKDHVYAKGFDAKKIAPEAGYFQPDVRMDANTELPLPNARLFPFTCHAGEALLLLEREGGIVVSGDALQNWKETDPYFTTLGSIMMRLMGFIKPHNVGPGWLKAARPDLRELKAILGLEFEHVLPVHGTPVIGGAREAYRPAIERLS
jgi:hypothetical protein